MDSSSPSDQKEIIDEVYGFIKVYRDGAVERPPFPGGYLPASPQFSAGLASKDVIIDPDRGLWVRLFLPQSVASSAAKCPLVLHFHGGGLCSGTPAAKSFHRFCSKMAVESQSIWVSVDYRLAPEYRLPSAYDDAHAAFMWLCAQAHMQASHFPGQVPHAGNLHRNDEHEKSDGALAEDDAKGHVKNKHYGIDADVFHTNGTHVSGSHTYCIHGEAAKPGSCECHMNGLVDNSHTCSSHGEAANQGSCGCHSNGYAGNAHTCTAHAKKAMHGSHGHDKNGYFTDIHVHIDGSHSGLTPEPWLCNHADFSKCFLAGESSGGAIVHYLAMRLVSHKYSLVQVQGLMLIHAALLIEGIYDVSYDPRVERRPDTYKSLCLPVGAAWDHPLVNPLHVHAPSINGIILPPFIVAIAEHDKFCAPGKYYVHAMKQCGHVAELHMTEGQGHCFYLYHPRSKEAELMVKHLVAFMHQQCKLQSRQSLL